VTGAPDAPRQRWLSLWLRDSLVAAGPQLATVVATAAMAIVVARELGPAAFGTFSAFLGVSMALNILAISGLGTWLLRELSRAIAEGTGRARAGASADLSAAATLAATTALPLIGITVAAALVLGLGIELVAALAGLMAYSAAALLASVLEVSFRAERRLRYVVHATLVEKAVLVALVGLALAVGEGIVVIAAAYTVAGMVRVAFDLRGMRALASFDLRVTSFQTAAEVGRLSLPFGLPAALPVAVQRLDIPLIGLVSAGGAGLFAVGDRVVAVLLIVPAVASTTLYPLIVGQRSVIRASWMAAAAGVVVGIVLAVSGIALAPWLVPLAFGERYRDAVGVVQTLLVALPFIFATGPLLVGLYSLELERRVLNFSVSIAIVTSTFVVGGQLLAGPVGAAAGYAARHLVYLAVLGWLSFTTRDHAAATRAVPEFRS